MLGRFSLRKNVSITFQGHQLFQTVDIVWNIFLHFRRNELLDREQLDRAVILNITFILHISG